MISGNLVMFLSVVFCNQIFLSMVNFLIVLKIVIVYLL